METEKTQTKKIWRQKVTGGIALKFVLVILSFVQAHWVPIACAAGTVAAASMFGDKSYMRNLAEDLQAMLKEGKAEDAVKLLESKIEEYHLWRQENLNDAEKTDSYLPDMYFQLAKAKGAAGVPSEQLVEHYKKAVFSCNAFSCNAGNAFVWLYENLTLTDYKRLVENYIDSISDDGSKKSMRRDIVESFEQANNWPAFKEFIQVTFSRSEKPVEYARLFERGLSKDSTWIKEYMDYCRSRPDLLEYVFEKDYKQAEQYKKQENFAKAAEVYEGILKASGSEKDTSQLKLAICEALLNAGEYQKVISKISSFIAEYKATNRDLVKEATLMKGRVFIQLSEVDKAINEFLTLMIEYPETKESPEASFFVGYCYMLQGKFDQAKEALNLVVNDYPQSSFASKARLCLIRIQNMTE